VPPSCPWPFRAGAFCSFGIPVSQSQGTPFFYGVFLLRTGAGSAAVPALSQHLCPAGSVPAAAYPRVCLLTPAPRVFQHAHFPAGGGGRGAAPASRRGRAQQRQPLDAGAGQVSGGAGQRRLRAPCPAREPAVPGCGAGASPPPNAALFLPLPGNAPRGLLFRSSVPVSILRLFAPCGHAEPGAAPGPRSWHGPLCCAVAKRARLWPKPWFRHGLHEKRWVESLLTFLLSHCKPPRNETPQKGLTGCLDRFTFAGELPWLN